MTSSPVLHLGGKLGEEGGISHQSSLSCSSLVCVGHNDTLQLAIGIQLPCRLTTCIPLTIQSIIIANYDIQCLVLHHYKAQLPALAMYTVVAHNNGKSTYMYSFLSITHHLVHVYMQTAWLVSGWGKRCRTRNSQGISVLLCQTVMQTCGCKL